MTKISHDLNIAILIISIFLIIFGSVLYNLPSYDNKSTPKQKKYSIGMIITGCSILVITLVLTST
jgi:hypothetical protein